MKIWTGKRLILFDGQGESHAFRLRRPFVLALAVLIGSAALCYAALTLVWTLKITTRAGLVIAEHKAERLQSHLLSMHAYAVRAEAQFDSLFYRDDRRRAIAGAEPVHEGIRQVGIGGPLEGSATDTRTTARELWMTRALTERFDKLLRQSSFHLFSLDRFHEFFEKQEKVFSCIPTLVPSQGFFHSGFGMRLHPLLHRVRMHKGVDIAHFTGAPVVSAADGDAKVGISESFGTYVVVNHNNGYTTIYAHLFSSAVEDGAHVKRGDILGYIGNSGLSKGPHLHYEVRKEGNPVDPLPYMLPPNYIVD